ncbi:MAG: dihydrofolate reductase [Bacteroidetes bacterium]|nr:dihydrofolate reductase [Bacteroidota bacterium]
MKVALIVAIDSARGIGKNNDLMWHLPNDMKFFKETTQNHIVIMGRKNYDSIPEKYRPLTNRLNVVLTRNTDFQAPGCKVFSSLESCFEYFKNEIERKVFIIGGGEIYKMALASNRIEEMFITFIDKEYGADTFFPDFDETQWESEVILIQNRDDKHEASFITKKYYR